VDIANYGEDSLMLAEAPTQMNWFMHHNMWERYYDTWDCKVNVYIYTGRVQTALREAQNILDDANVRQNNFGRAVAYMQMGIIYESMGQYDQAVHVFKECLGQLKDSYRDSEVLTNTYDYLCQTLHECYRFQEELNVTYELEKCIQERIGQKKASSKTLLNTYIACRCNRALALIQLRRYDEAGYELKQAEEAFRQQGAPLTQYRILLTRSYYYLAEDQPKLALEYCDSLERLGLNAGGDTKLLRGDILMRLGRPAEAARLFRNLYQGKDSTFTRDMRLQLDELNTLYKVEEIEMQGKLQNSRFMIGIAVILIVGLLLFTHFRFKAARKLADEHDKLVESNRKLEQSYKELKVANERAEEASKMKTNFIQQISHEIRTPLNILSGFTQVITTPGMDLDDNTKRDVSQRITENTNRITGLVNRMLALSDANSRTMIECNDQVPAVQIAAQAVEEVQITTNPKIDFDMLIAPEAESVMLQTNLQQATQALSQLLDNAQKFTYSKYSQADPSVKGRVTLSVNKGQQYLQFIVEDTGIGVPKQEAAHIFEEFVQLDNFYDGTGIGLTIARSVARRMGGDVVLDSTYTDGARFILRLPL
jgi:signal transduction histidine kinase